MVFHLKLARLTLDLDMDTAELSWNELDIERRLGFASKKYTGANTALTFLLGALLTLLFYAGLYPFFRHGGHEMVDMFFHGGPKSRSVIPYFTVFLASWSVAILAIKHQKLGLQRRALALDIMPADPSFVLAPDTAAAIIDRIHAKVDAPRKFLLLNRVERCLANLKNLGRVSDVAESLAAQADNDERYLDSTYTLVRGFVWAIPVLGFIGTVLGLAQAIGGFGEVVARGAELTELKASLGGVTGGLAIAFETTLIALVAALLIQLVLTFLKKQEEDFIDECSDYCHKNIISKLRTVDLRGDQ